MTYHAIGTMSGSSLDGLDIVCAQLTETSGKWEYQVLCAGCLEYPDEWTKKLKDAIHYSAEDYMLLHSDYGKYTGEKINEFIEMNQLQHRISLVASHGHTTFHRPDRGMTHQLGDGATIAAVTGLPVVSDLRNLDVAFGGQGAPIVPLGEKLLFPEFPFLLNIGGIANISIKTDERYVAFDICPANRVLNMLSAQNRQKFDEGGKLAASGRVDENLLLVLNNLDYYQKPYPKSLANSFGTDIVYPLIQNYLLTPEDALATYCEHIAIQVSDTLKPFATNDTQKLFVTGGGAFNSFLTDRISDKISDLNMEVEIPADLVVAYKEALIMALLGVLRWREQDTVLASVTGARRNSIGGALWLGSDA